MKRRWAWNIFCASSLLIFASSVALWVRSYITADALQKISDRSGLPPGSSTWNYLRWTFDSTRGSIGVVRSRGQADDIPLAVTEWFISHRQPFVRNTGPLGIKGAWDLKFAGFQLQWYGGDVSGNRLFGRVIIPLWFFLPFALPPLAWWWKRNSARGRGFPITVAESNAGSSS